MQNNLNLLTLFKPRDVIQLEYLMLCCRLTCSFHFLCWFVLHESSVAPEHFGIVFGLLQGSDRYPSLIRNYMHIFKIYFLLRYSWLTMFLVYSRVIQLYICVCIYIFFHCGLLQDINYKPLYYIVGPCCLSILYAIACILLIPKSQYTPSLTSPHFCQPQVCRNCILSYRIWMCRIYKYIEYTVVTGRFTTISTISASVCCMFFPTGRKPDTNWMLAKLTPAWY